MILLLGFAAAELTELWVPTLTRTGELGRDGLVVTDLDGDGEVDILVPQDLDGALGFVVRLSADTTVTHEQALDLDIVHSAWRFGSWDPDTGAEVFFSYQTASAGAYAVMQGEVLAEPPTAWGAGGLMGGEGRGDESRFGRDIQNVDLDGDGVDELVLTSPTTGAVFVLRYAEGEVDSADYAGRWQGEAGVNLGWDLMVVDDRDGDGNPDLMAASDEGLHLLGSADAFQENVVSGAPDVVVGIDPPRGLAQIPDMDGDGLKDIAWLSSDAMLWLSPENGEISSWPITPTGDVLGTDDGVWVSDGGQAKYYTLLTGPQEAYAVGGATMGAAMQSAGDLNGDGCDEVYTTAPEIGRLYTMSPDCDQQGGDDTGDTGDTGDTEVPDDTAADDTDAPEPCLPEFGWTCGLGPSRSLAGWLVALGLLAVWPMRR